MAAIGSPHTDCRQDCAPLGGARESYLFNSGIAGIERTDRILLIGTNPRWEAPLVNARIRKAWLANLGIKIALIGEKRDLTYGYDHLGAGPESLAKGAEFLKGAGQPMVIVGMGAIARADGAAVLAQIASLAKDAGVVTDRWNGFNVLHTAAARVAALDLGFLPKAGGRDFAGILKGVADGAIDVVYNLGCDEFDTSKLSGAFVIYQGHHGDSGARRADVIFPGASYVEQAGVYANLEGRAQLANRAHFPFGEAREDWAIIRALSDHVGKTLPYDDLFALRQAMIADAPALGRIDQRPSSAAALDLSRMGVKGTVSSEPFRSPIRDFYMTNPIARASKTMAECSAVMSGAAKMAAE
jgi:NADH-quinone oxidoreductase subunit G